MVRWFVLVSCHPIPVMRHHFLMYSFCLGWKPILSLPIVIGLLGIGADAIAQPTTDEPILHTIPIPQRSPERPVLQRGSEGASVRELQAVLSLMGYYSGEINGQYQETTAIAVSAFQQSAGLPADGVMGPNTWNALFPSADALRSSRPAPTADASMPEMSSESSGFPTPSMLSNSPNTVSAEATMDDQPPADQPTSETAAPPSSDRDDTTATTDLPILRVGMRGFAVERLQERLQTLGFYTGAIDGIFGPATESAVQTLQRANALNPDGIVGAETWTVLFQ
jgi:peptidoglycan hydrolase-like protein with peptidoglycan-binding domain